MLSGGSPSGVVAGEPTLSHGSLSGVSKGEPTLGFRLSVGSGGPAVTGFTVEVPPGLSFRGGRITEGFSLRGGRASLKTRPGRLSVSLKSPARSLAVTIGPPGLAVTRELVREAREHSLDELAIGVKATDTAGRTTKLFVYRYYEVRPRPPGG